jgi:hypothetical protein
MYAGKHLKKFKGHYSLKITKQSQKRVEQVLPGSEEGGEEGRGPGAGVRGGGEKWPKKCMHMNK